jgi:6-phosphogluconolactonase/glucosamine-6-phosphate isomerase/deaminase
VTGNWWTDAAHTAQAGAIPQANDYVHIDGATAPDTAPMAITLGMRELLGARRVRLYSETGAWKQTVIRVLLFGHVSPEVPVTYCQEHPDCEVTVDAATAACPPLGI